MLQVPQETAVPDLYRLAFMPGCFRCPKCGFILTKAVLNPTTGECGTREQERESEPCPTDGTMMVHVTYQEQLEVYAARLKEEFERTEVHEKALNNIFMLVRRNLRRSTGFDPIAMSNHILRFCADAGCKSSILRDDGEN